MLKELIKNKEKYFWTITPKGNIQLGNSALGVKSIVTFTLTQHWANITPLVEDIPGSYIGHPQNYPKGNPTYILVEKLTHTIKEYLKVTSPLKKEQVFIVSQNTHNLLINYYKKK